ncbi:MAG: radical SAM protein [Candidatus Vogelbacteria bacterium]|nr:radical SAM protein [Candidatus Vogelbacteria bacterium]
MAENIETLSIVTGTAACNARCPFCVSKMTAPNGVELKPQSIDWRSFRKVCMAAFQGRCKTVMFTGKGEPTIGSGANEITEYLKALKGMFGGFFEFPYIELQTNGIAIAENPEKYAPYLKEWYDLGLQTIAISVVHFNPEENRKIYLPYKKEYIDLPALFKLLHGYGFTVRLTCIMTKDRIGSLNRVKQMITFAKENKIEQMTLTPVNKPEDFSDDNDLEKEAWLWTRDNHIDPEDLAEIRGYFETNGTHILTLPHGAKVFDVEGQNVCLNQCLTVQPENKELRNLIFFPNGDHRYYWQHSGAILM